MRAFIPRLLKKILQYIYPEFKLGIRALSLNQDKLNEYERLFAVQINGVDVQVLHNSLIYIDPRGTDEAKYLEKSIGFEKVLNTYGASIHSMYTICKIMWLKKHMPEVFNNT